MAGSTNSLSERRQTMQKLTPFLWFNDKAEEALDFYAGVFPDAKVLERVYFPDEVPGLGGTLMTGTLELFGLRIAVLNGAPEHVRFSDAMSLAVTCGSQKEIDSYWDQLTADGGQESQCGWLKDKYGFAWQIVPSILEGLLRDADPQKAGRAMQAMMTMQKLDIAKLTAAHEGR
jgi:predicted 3-demethylubiquinone-9 3-methyltransferase (glyoxalase superfamily)